MKFIEKPDFPGAAKWKTQLVNMKIGDSFIVPIVKGNAVRRAAWSMRMRIEIHKMLVVWKVGKMKKKEDYPSNGSEG